MGSCERFVEAFDDGFGSEHHDHEGDERDQAAELDAVAEDQVDDLEMTNFDPNNTIQVARSRRAIAPVEYPVETLHEITTNAVLHRDYSIADDVHVRIFDNRLEVESPGRLPAHITPGNVLEERFSTNGKLVRWINKFPDPPNKDIGEGLRTAFEAMRALRLHPPGSLRASTRFS